jgi:hypothetical protein
MTAHFEPGNPIFICLDEAWWEDDDEAIETEAEFVVRAHVLLTEAAGRNLTVDENALFFMALAWLHAYNDGNDLNPGTYEIQEVQHV